MPVIIYLGQGVLAVPIYDTIICILLYILGPIHSNLHRADSSMTIYYFQLIMNCCHYTFIRMSLFGFHARVFDM